MTMCTYHMSASITCFALTHKKIHNNNIVLDKCTFKEACWVCAGYVLVMCWVCAGYVLGTCWVSAGYVLVMCWVRAG